MPGAAILTAFFSLPLPVAIHDIQGPGHVSPLVGQVVDVAGVVTKVGSACFYRQDDAPDDDERTSEAMCVKRDAKIAMGDVVRVMAAIPEVRPGCDGWSQTSVSYENLTTTEI